MLVFLVGDFDYQRPFILIIDLFSLFAVELLGLSFDFTCLYPDFTGVLGKGIVAFFGFHLFEHVSDPIKYFGIAGQILFNRLAVAHGLKDDVVLLFITGQFKKDLFEGGIVDLGGVLFIIASAVRFHFHRIFKNVHKVSSRILLNSLTFSFVTNYHNSPRFVNMRDKRNLKAAESHAKLSGLLSGCCCARPIFHYLYVVKYLIVLTLVACISLADQLAALPAPPPLIEHEFFSISSRNPASARIADKIIAETRRRLITLVADSLPYKPEIYLADNLADFDSLVGGRFPDWGAGAALAERHMIVLKSPDVFNINRSFEELLAHEYAHLVVAYKAGFFEAPRWFNEGLAMYVSTEWSWSDGLAMSRAAVFGHFIDLKDIELVNRFGEGKAHVAYAESYLAVSYMVETYGTGSIAAFLSQIGKGASVDQALYFAVGSNYTEFQNELDQYLRKRFNIVSLYMDTMFFWLSLAILVIVAGFIRYRRRRTYFKKWEQQERYESTDFEFGDPDEPEKTDDEDEPWRN